MSESLLSYCKKCKCSLGVWGSHSTCKCDPNHDKKCVCMKKVSE